MHILVYTAWMLVKGDFRGWYTTGPLVNHPKGPTEQLLSWTWPWKGPILSQKLDANGAKCHFDGIALYKVFFTLYFQHRIYPWQELCWYIINIDQLGARNWQIYMKICQGRNSTRIPNTILIPIKKITLKKPLTWLNLIVWFDT